jgi:predicted nucleic acid-binding Zn finger protein
MKSNITFHSPNHATVKSFTTEDKYEVNLERSTCSCMDFTMRGYKTPGYQCKHLKTVRGFIKVNRNI